jgi:hypothetical protein
MSGKKILWTFFLYTAKSLMLGVLGWEGPILVTKMYIFSVFGGVLEMDLLSPHAFYGGRGCKVRGAEQANGAVLAVIFSIQSMHFKFHIKNESFVYSAPLTLTLSPHKKRGWERETSAASLQK